MVITKRGAPAPALSPEESALLAGAPPGSVATGIRPGAVHGGPTNQTGPARGAPVPFLSEAETAIFASMPTEVHEYVAGLPTDRQRCQARRIIVDLHNEAKARARAEFIAALPPRRVDVQDGIFQRIMAGLRKAFAAPETGEQTASSSLPTDPATEAALDKQAKAIVARLPKD